MNKSNVALDLTEIQFLTILIATMKINAMENIIDKYQLQRDLYPFYENENFKILFQDIIKKELPDDHFVDLSVPFEYAYAMGMLSLIKDCNDVKSIINISEEDANLILAKANPNIVSKMNELCNSLRAKNMGMQKQINAIS